MIRLKYSEKFNSLTVERFSYVHVFVKSRLNEKWLLIRVQYVLGIDLCE